MSNMWNLFGYGMMYAATAKNDDLGNCIIHAIKEAVAPSIKRNEKEIINSFCEPFWDSEEITVPKTKNEFIGVMNSKILTLIEEFKRKGVSKINSLKIETPLTVETVNDIKDNFSTLIDGYSISDLEVEGFNFYGIEDASCEEDIIAVIKPAIKNMINTCIDFSVSLLCGSAVQQQAQPVDQVVTEAREELNTRSGSILPMPFVVFDEFNNSSIPSFEEGVINSHFVFDEKMRVPNYMHPQLHDVLLFVASALPQLGINPSVRFRFVGFTNSTCFHLMAINDKNEFIIDQNAVMVTVDTDMQNHVTITVSNYNDLVGTGLLRRLFGSTTEATAKDTECETVIYQ